jgi:hypothetical protein
MNAEEKNNQRKKETLKKKENEIENIEGKEKNYGHDGQQIKE